MELSEYQHEAQKTDQARGTEGTALVVPLLGMAGEVGSLLVEYKKFLRDGSAHRLFTEQVAEEIGDILWYLANLAAKFGVDLDAVARENLAKTRDRWPPTLGMSHLLDEGSPPSEQLPRQFVAELSDTPEEARAVLTVDGQQVGDALRDNSRREDGYRFHDVMHLAHVAVLGWSPVLRKFMKRKRKSLPEVDDAEDGGRAIIIEEAIVAFVFDYAKKHDFLAGVDGVDYSLLKTIKSLTADLEVKVRSAHEWEEAILKGYETWRAVRKSGGGRIQVDTLARTVVMM